MTNNLKITEKENNGLKRAYEVVIDKKDIEAKIDSEVKKIGQKAKVPGFRPGKVPMSILRQRYGANVMGDVIEGSVNGAIQKVIEENKLTPALKPKAEIIDFMEGGDLSFKMELEIMPDAPKVAIEKLKLTKQTFEISDKEIDEALGRVAESNRTLTAKAKTAKAKEGDTVKIDFKGFLGDEPFAGGEGKDFNLELGGGQFILGFEEQLIGAKSGDDVTVNVTFPTEYHSEDLAGKEVRFEVTIHEILEASLPKIDDEFAKTLGMEDLKAIKQAIKEQLEKDYGSLARSKLKKSLFDELDGQCEFDVPEAMVAMEFESIWKQFEEAKERGETDDSRDEAELKEEYNQIANRRVRLGIFLSQIARENSLEVTKEELTKSVFEQARMYPGQEQKIFEFYQKNPAQMQELRGPLLEEKAVDYILEAAKIDDKKVTIEELLKEDDDTIEGKPSKAKKKAATKKPAAKKDAAKKDDTKTATKKPAAKKKAPAKKKA